MSLTIKRVAKLMRGGKPGRHLDSGNTGVRGLYLVVANRRAAHWELRYQLNGHGRWMGLGSAREFNLGQARERALEHRRKLADKTDPLTVRRAERATAAAAKASQQAAAAKAMTFKQCAEAYIAENQAAWRNPRHGKQWHSTLETFACPDIGDLNVADIDTPLVLKVLRQKVEAERGHPAGPLWTARAETASRLRGRIESILAWAKVSGYRGGDNPARWKDHLEEALPERAKIAKVEHFPALPFEELPAFMAALRQREGVAARALEFTILTAARTGETLGAPWSEIDLAAKLWTIPAERMKKGDREHRVPLAAPVIELLENLHTEQDNPYLFIGTRAGKGLSDAAMTSMLKRMGHGDITTHGFRSTFMDWAHERTIGFSKPVIDMALAHVVGDKVEAAYRRGDLLAKRTRLMDSWAKYCASPPVKASADVVSINRAQQ
jgi:integrase